MITLSEACIEDIALIQELANKTWPVAYKEILIPEQLEYMLQLIYSTESLRQQMTDGHRFILAFEDKSPAGFASWSMFQNDKTAAKLQKLYVLPQFQGRNLGYLLLEKVTDAAKTNGLTKLLLNVNRHNSARYFYKKHGFVIQKEEDIDIGNGYFMNDFVMEKTL